VGGTLWLLNVGTLVTKIKVSGLWNICDVSVGKLFLRHSHSGKEHLFRLV
jgi:hypothetical protein